MAKEPHFISDSAREFFEHGAARSVIFSEGTYQVQIVEPSNHEEYWPFIQVGDDGELHDSFCSCSKGQECDHIAAGYLLICRDGDPMHVAFRESLWNVLGRMAAKRHGYEVSCLIDDDDALVAETSSGKKVFSFEPLRRRGESFVTEYILEREEETEETSIKFSNLPPEELALWRKGTPSHFLQYELSFWSDIAKFLFVRQYMGDRYSIHFEKEKDRFNGLKVEFPDVEVSFYIAEPNWNQVIPSLGSVHSKYHYHKVANVELSSIFYDEKANAFRIHTVDDRHTIEQAHEEYGKYVFVENDGFYPKQNDPLLEKKVVEPRFVPHFLETYRELLEKHLKNTSIHHDKVTPKYTLHFDEKDALHIDMHIFEEGDLQTQYARKLGNFVYIEEKGFFPIDEVMFSDVSTVVPKEKIGEFITLHRAFLNERKGYETHLSNVETRIVYSMDRRKNLYFSSETSFLGDGKDLIDLGSWIYIHGKGFYSKQLGRSHAFLSTGHSVNKEEISSFIDTHKEELETVPGFFSFHCPIDKAGLEVKIRKDEKIELTPRLSYKPNYKKSQVTLLGGYTYVEGEGFAELPKQMQVPTKYSNGYVIDQKSEAFFVTCELAKLKPNIVKLDKRLSVPEKLQLKIRKLKKARKQWDVELYYESEFGSIALDVFYEAMSDPSGYMKSDAGLLFFKDPRFQWLRELDEKPFVANGSLRLSTMQWMRLSIVENVRPPMGKTKEAQEASRLFKEMRALTPDDAPNVSYLKSSLRPYQEMGVKWLWFLYANGLSGLLCDEMGLGKTHQAMAIMAAAFFDSKKAKFLVVCPTSVIYHWEDLLKKFLPKLRVLVYYGAKRSVKGFTQHYDLLLTSYGTLRTEKRSVERISFDIAVFDEIQVAKNHLSQTHKTVSSLKASMRLGLTGTPIENKLVELKALFDLVLPAYFPSQTMFRDMFVSPIEKENNAQAKKLLGKLIHPFLLRRKKTEVLKDLPEKIEEVTHCPLSDEQKRLYKETFLREEEKAISDMNGGGNMHVFALLTKLKRICNHPALVYNTPEQYHKYESGKWDLFTELLEEIRESGQKVVVFTQYLEMLDIIEHYLRDQNIGFAGIRGSTKDRREQIEIFTNDPNCTVFTASLKAVGVGVDLVAASVVIHYDRWWNPAVEDQATDRVHRMGQKRGVQVFKLVTRNTVEEHIDALIKKKVSLTKGVISYDDEAPSKALSRDDLKELMGLIHNDLSE